MLRAESGQEIVVRGNQVWEGGPYGFFRAFLTNVEAVVGNVGDAKEVTAVFVSKCKNYDGDRFSAYVSCKADYDAEQDRFVAKLDREKCSSDEPRYHTDFSFFNDYGWYMKGRTGYYYSQGCSAEIAVVADGQWLKDPVTQGNNFGLMFDMKYSEAATP